MRIARFSSSGSDPRYGVVEGARGEEEVVVVAGDPLFTPLSPTGERVPLADARLLAPVIPRSKVLGIGRNYAAHAAELGNEVPAEPLVFTVPNTSVAGPGDPLVIPAWAGEELHYEGELAVVIRRLCKDVPVERVPEVVFGYTVANDITARSLQGPDQQWWRAKGADGFTPIGPWIETDLDPSDLRIETRRITGDEVEVVQDGRTSLMVHDVAAIVAHVSSAMTLLPGDVILTGTPAGVGPVRAGQRVEVEIEGLGVLSTTFTAPERG
ncbi:2-keto-4-pentenoate hydratase/2-oxohepta-3-ene-1,7-dioic acid hydratase in catechol pathway [Kineococcus radiotolerans]|uniref:2-keto-4-pentenoate hydratase/2-oxohepta-3-ene-1,7-dioic acid hydratase in catechol pathway n=1 Tax=Kineococcus radiotolerans TaxID=131568 RepID=A0A7W4XW82_KINRA|nr:fumarylacetoacetate hydrolase family protein [Kineococcus radiotolerans]MBB2899959.1 2-keto-4-pentenoate hydratase/2-oxohepta-3-ene-1,7-dioic acid hydratase in catechol pathway [Kineococcus radiotolerans]